MTRASGGLFLAVDQCIRLVERLQFLDLIRESCRRRPHVELPGDHVGDQTGAVFAEEREFALREVNSTPCVYRLFADNLDDGALLLRWRT